MKLLVVLSWVITITACQSGNSVSGNENGSEPVNQQEAYDMQKAVNRCHRTGGTRIVKVKGELKCY